MSGTWEDRQDLRLKEVKRRPTSLPSTVRNQSLEPKKQDEVIYVYYSESIEENTKIINSKNLQVNASGQRATWQNHCFFMQTLENYGYI